jgi:hypothetical protein
MKGNSTEISDLALSINTPHYFLLDDELIVFSPAKQEYFGIAGAARLVFDALIEAAGRATERDIRQQIGATHTLTPAAIEHIRNAIGSLLELEVLHEQ